MDLNNPETWNETPFAAAPENVDAEGYQSLIDAICGLNPFGGPNVRLTWMPSVENYSRYYSEWDQAGFGTKIVPRGMYVFDQIFAPDGTRCDIAPPRWALKQFVHPSRYLASDDASRWLRADAGSQIFVRENRPPLPLGGYYTRLIGIGRHTSFCCRALKARNLTCWGDYREPDESYLELLKNAVCDRAERNEQNPNEPLSPATLARAAREAAAEIQEKRRRAEEGQREFITENMDALLARLAPEIKGNRAVNGK